MKRQYNRRSNQAMESRRRADTGVGEVMEQTIILTALPLGSNQEKHMKAEELSIDVAFMYASATVITAMRRRAVLVGQCLRHAFQVAHAFIDAVTAGKGDRRTTCHLVEYPVFRY